MRFAGVTALAGAVLLVAGAHAQEAPQPAGNSAPELPVATEMLTSPRIRKPLDLQYSWAAVSGLREGWVDVGMMVDATGKPYEVTVVASSGDKEFEASAVKAIEAAEFTPGMANGKPIESATEFKVVFAITGDASPKAASTKFASEYFALTRAAKAKDRRAADAAMGRMVVQNLYEDAHYGLAQYLYASIWGDAAQQLAGLRRAVAHETQAQYLPKAAFQAALMQSLILDISSHDYDDALNMWASLQKSVADPGALEKLRPTIHAVNALRTSDAAYGVHGSMTGGTWNFGLFKQNFRLTVASGHIAEIKLRCARGFVQFAFDPALQYKVESRYGSCKMELDGIPGTQFTLTQF